MERRSEEDWDRLLQEQAESGKSQAEFCREQGISAASFYWQVKKRRHRSRFVEIAVTKEPEQQREHRAELELPGGVIFRMSW